MNLIINVMTHRLPRPLLRMASNATYKHDFHEFCVMFSDFAEVLWDIIIHSDSSKPNQDYDRKGL
jgi:hypothetical protein